MKKVMKRIKRKPTSLFMIIFNILFLFSSICLIYTILRVANIEDLLRYMTTFLIFLFIIFSFLETFKLTFKGKNIAIILWGIILVLLFIGESIACGMINGIYDKVKNIYKESNTYSTSLIVLSNNKINDIKNFKSMKIGVINDENSTDYKIAYEIIKENKLESSNEIVKYNSTGEIIEALYNKEIGGSFVPSNYVSMYTNIDKYKNIKGETKEIISKIKVIEKSSTSSNKKSNEPFTVLLLGMDSTMDDISKITSFNADSIMLVTFNPSTYNATILSIPRDTYVPITCIKNSPNSKVTHSGWNGESCVISTLEKWMDIKIDYYVKVNFTGVVNLVDKLNGVEIDVPYSFCEQNSKREWGKNTVYVEKGKQILNGEQVLAFTRNRHPNPDMCSSKWTNYYSDDIVRGQNQQIAMNAILNKIIKTSNLDTIYSLLDVVGKNIDTNMKVEEMTSYYNVIKDIALNTINSDKDIITFERLYLQTYGKNLYDPLLNLPGMSMQIYYKDSFNAVTKEMKTNLDLEKPETYKSINFSINNLYKATTIGKGNFNQEDIKTVPNFIGKDKKVALNWGKENNIKIIIEEKEIETGTNNAIISQSIPSTYIIDNITSKSITITTAKVTKSNINNKDKDKDNKEEDNKEINNDSKKYPTE